MFKTDFSFEQQNIRVNSQQTACVLILAPSFITIWPWGNYFKYLSLPQFPLVYNMRVIIFSKEFFENDMHTCHLESARLMDVYDHHY